MCNIGSGHAYDHGDAVHVVVGNVNALVDQPAPPELGCDGRRLVKNDAAADLAGCAGHQVPLLIPLDHPAFQILFAANGPAEGEVDARRIVVDAKTPYAWLRSPSVVVELVGKGVVVFAEIVLLPRPRTRCADGHLAHVGDNGAEAE